MSYVSQGLYLQELKNKKIATETNRQSLIKLDKDVKEIAIVYLQIVLVKILI